MRKQKHETELIKTISNYWSNGDIQRAWLEIYHYTQHDWVKYVIDSLELPPLELIHSVSIKERAKKIREEVEQKVLDIKIPRRLASLDQLKDNLCSLYQKLDPQDHSLVPWLTQTTESLLAKEVDESPLTVAILGEFSSGKSRLINALLGDKILSVGLVPVTRSVTKIRYGQNRSVTIKYENKNSKSIRLDQLKAYIDERKKLDTPEADIKEVIIHFPADVLKRIEIWDTPGFNSNNELHDQVATQLLNEADVVVWAMAAHQIGSKSESKLLKIAEKLKGRVLAVLNQVDRLGNIEAINEQVKEALEHYKDYVTDVIPTSAKWIEQGKESGNLSSFIEALHQIGKWNRELKQEALKRTLIANSCKLDVYLSIKLEEEQRQQNVYKKHEAEYNTLTKSWLEVEQHCMLIYKVSPCIKNDKIQHLDQYFYHIKKYPRLTNMYIAIDQAESKQDFINVFHAIYNLEHAFWNIGPREKPTPWKKDFISHIQMAISIDRSQHHNGLRPLPAWPSFFIIKMHRSYDIRILNRYSTEMSQKGADVNIVDIYMCFKFLSDRLSRIRSSNYFFTNSEINEMSKALEKINNAKHLKHLNICIDHPQEVVLNLREILDSIIDLQSAKKRQDKLSMAMDAFERSVKDLDIKPKSFDDFRNEDMEPLLAAGLSIIPVSLYLIVKFGFFKFLLYGGIGVVIYITIIIFGKVIGKYLARKQYGEFDRWNS